MSLKKSIIFLLTTLAFASSQEGSPSMEMNDELENISYSAGQLSGFSITGTGILTAKPDNVFVQFTVKSAASANLKSAEVDVTQKVDFLIRGICREFKIKKESFSVANAGTQMQERTKKGASANDQFDDEGNRIKKKTFSNTAKKTIVINNLGGKKQSEVMDILDAATKYGGALISVADAEETGSESVEEISSSSAQSKAVKGSTKTKITENIQDSANQLINYHMNEETLKKLLKEAKTAAMLEIKQKYAKATAKIKIKEEEYNIDIKEDNNVTSDENGLLTIKTEVSATYKKQTKQEKEGK